MLLKKLVSDWRGALEEAKETSWLALPALVSQFCRIAVYIVNGLFLGRLEDDAMAAAAVGGSWHSAALYFGIGISFAMDTLVSQAFGARNFKFIGIVFQNSLVVVSILFIPIALAFWYTEPVLVLLKQDPALSKLAGTYNRYLIPGVLPLLIYRSMCQYLQNQRILTPAMVSGALSVLLSIPANWILIYGLPEFHFFGLHGAALHSELKVYGGWKGLGFIGAPIAGSLTWLAQPIFLWIYVSYTGVHKPTCDRCDLKQALKPKNLIEFLKLGIPASFMLALEVIGFELATIFVGTFKNAHAIKAHSIGFNLMTFVFIIPLGFSIGSTTRVGNMLGAGNAAAAKFSAVVGFIIIFSILIFATLIMIAFKAHIPKIYSNSPEVLEFCKQLMPFVAFLCLFDGLQTFLSSLMRSLGKPLLGSIICFVGYYLMALPVGAGLAFGARLQTIGVWWGLVAGMFGAVAGYSILLYRVDWEQEAINAKNRVANTDDVIAVSLLDGEYESLPETTGSATNNSLEEMDNDDTAIERLDFEDDEHGDVALYLEEDELDEEEGEE